MSQVKILIVDDSEFILQLLQTIFLTEGFDTRIARDGVSALRQAIADPPDVVLLDVRMPHLDGWGVLERLRADDRTGRLPVVMTSTDDHVTGTAQAAARSAQAYVMKPFSPSALVWAVRDALGSGPRGHGVAWSHMSSKKINQIDI